MMSTTETKGAALITGASAGIAAVHRQSKRGTAVMVLATAAGLSLMAVGTPAAGEFGPGSLVHDDASLNLSLADLNGAIQAQYAQEVLLVAPHAPVIDQDRFQEVATTPAVSPSKPAPPVPSFGPSIFDDRSFAENIAVLNQGLMRKDARRIP